MNVAQQAARQMPIPLLVTIAADGYVEVYGQKDIDVHIVILPAVDSKAGEIAAEEYVELSIPIRHREIYFPGMIRAAKFGRRISPQEIDETIQNVIALRTIDAIRMVMAEVA